MTVVGDQLSAKAKRAVSANPFQAILDEALRIKKLERGIIGRGFLEFGPMIDKYARHYVDVINAYHSFDQVRAEFTNGPSAKEWEFYGIRVTLDADKSFSLVFPRRQISGHPNDTTPLLNREAESVLMELLDFSLRSRLRV